MCTNRQSWTKSLLALVVGAGILFAAGCRVAKPEEQEQEAKTFVEVSGLVQDYGSGDQLGDVVITATGGATQSTQEDGSFRIQVEVTSGRGSITAAKEGFAPNSRTILPGQPITNISVTLLAVDQEFTVSPTADESLQVMGTPAGLDLEANSLVVAGSRAAATGELTVALTSIDPFAAPETMPGDFTGAQGAIESFGALNVQISDSQGREVNLGSGKTAVVRIAVPANAIDPPDSIPLFYFDGDSGLWVEEGTADLVGTSPNWYYSGEVEHFSTWNADQYYDRVTIKGKVVDTNEQPVDGATVTVFGRSYSGTSVTRTDASGLFTTYAKSRSTVLVRAENDGKTSNTRILTTGLNGATDTTLVDDPLVIGDTVGITIQLTWGASPRDLDSHLTGPSPGSSTRFHVYFASPGSLEQSPFAALDVDDTTSYGPEVITINELNAGTYRYSVYNYSGSPAISTSEARVEANINGVRYVYSVPTGTGLLWTVFELNVAADGTVTVQDVDSISSTTSPSVGPPRTPSTKGPLPAELLGRF